MEQEPPDQQPQNTPDAHVAREQELLTAIAALQQQVARLQAGRQLQSTEILESINDAFYALDAGFRFIYTNAKALEWWGMSGIDLIGQNIWDVFPAAKNTHTGEMHILALTEQRVMRYETLSPVLKRWINVSIYPDRSGGLSVYFQDITERKVAEDALRASEGKFRSLFDALDEAIAIVALVPAVPGAERDCVVLDHNPAWLRLMKLQEASGKRVSELRTLRDSPEVAVLCDALRLQPGERMEIYNPASGSWFDTYITPVAEGPSAPVGVVMSDITERKRADTRNRYLVKLSDAIGPLSAPDAIIRAASEQLGLQLGAQWVVYGEAVRAGGELFFRSAGQFSAGPDIPAGPFATADFSAAIGILSRGENLVVGDIGEILPPSDHAGFAALEVKSLAVVPFLKHGELLFTFGAYEPRPRSWTDEDLDLIRITADRTWAALERARTAIELRESEAQLRVTMESATDYAIISTDIRGIILGWSAGAELIFGYTAAEAIGQSANIIFTPEDVASGAPEREMANARSQGWAADERWHLRRDGTRFYMSGVMRPIFNPGLQGYVKVARDMTEHQQAADRLRVSEERHRIALSSAEMGAWDWDIQSDKIVWNAQHFELMGLWPEDRQVSFDELMTFIYEEDREAVAATLRTSAYESGILNTEFRIRRHNTGEIRWMHGYGKVIAYQGPQPVRMAGVVFDITANKAIEQQKDEFIGVASHELKTPVTAIRAYAEVLEEILSTSGDAESYGLMRKLGSQIDRLGDLIYTLLDVTRMTSGTLELAHEPLDLAELLREVQDDLAYPQAGRIELRKLDEAPVTGSKMRLRQVMGNIVSNALRFAPEHTPIIIELTRTASQYQVSVRDFGPGIPADKAEAIFERYSRGSDGPAATYPGLGLGLFIASEIIRLHGGRMWSRTPDGPGAEIVFCLPAAGIS